MTTTYLIIGGYIIANIGGLLAGLCFSRAQYYKGYLDGKNEYKSTHHITYVKKGEKND